ncbi:abhydrolase associated lipase [Pelomyxa schiedti]|nr:abhydrolase associated lipase [Pelomyxa schiedti]
MWPLTKENGTAAAIAAASAVNLQSTTSSSTLVYFLTALSVLTLGGSLIVDALSLLLQGFGALLLTCVVLLGTADAIATSIKSLFTGRNLNDPYDVPVDDKDYETDNVSTNDVKVLAEHNGLQYEEHLVPTDDGHILLVHRVFCSKYSGSKSFLPVLCAHGVLNRAGVFIAGSKRSLAVYLANSGLDVWLMNSRAIFPLHTFMSTNDPRYWDWSLDELGHYDVPAALAFVQKATSSAKVAYIGHSQGAAQAFVALHDHPDLANDISVLIGLAPAVFVHPPSQWIVKNFLSRMSVPLIRILFGHSSFIPLMLLVQKYASAYFFGSLAYIVFNYLFSWNDHTWQKWRRGTYFQFTPAAVSSRLVGHWLANLRNGRLRKLRPTPVNYSKSSTDDEPSEYSNNEVENYQFENVNCNVAIFHAGNDNLVDSKPLAQAIREQSSGKIVHYEELAGYNHMDVIWGKDAPDRVFHNIVKLVRTSTRK